MPATVRQLTASLLLSGLPLWAAGDVPVITNAADVTVAVYETRAVGAPFALEATLLNLSETHVHFADGSGPAVASIKRPLNIDPRPQPGDRIRLGGDIRIGENTGRVYADCQNVARVSRGTPPVPRVVTAAEFLGGKCDFALVQVAGEVNDIVLAVWRKIRPSPS